MIVYNGKPVLEHNIELCKSYGVTEIYINVHHLPNIIMEKFGDGSQYGVSITYSHEDPLLGTAGAVKKIAHQYWEHSLNKGEPFLVVYGDTYSGYNIDALVKLSNDTNAMAVVGFHYRKDTQHSGVGEFSDTGRILRFIEKPKPGVSQSHWVNVGIYVLKAEIIDYIPEGFSDFGKNIFPDLLAHNIPMFGFCDDKDVKVFDTIEMYNRSFQKNKSLR
jgi:NDP-sugar pyrophosphorylase family protein